MSQIAKALTEGLEAIKRGDRLAVSRLTSTKSEANRIARQWKRLNGIAIKIHGKRGCYRVRARMPFAEFARFCADEAREQSKSP